MVTRPHSGMGILISYSNFGRTRGLIVLGECQASFRQILDHSHFLISIDGTMTPAVGSNRGHRDHRASVPGLVYEAICHFRFTARSRMQSGELSRRQPRRFGCWGVLAFETRLQHQRSLQVPLGRG